MSGERTPAAYRLNLGAAKTYIPGFVNIDISERAELPLDLGSDKLPFPDNSVQEIVSHHTLEHVHDYLFSLGEIYRVLEHDGELLLSLPYVSLTENNQVNPYHLNQFNEHSFGFFDPMVLKGSAGEDDEVRFRRVFVRYHYMGAFGFLPRPLRVWCRRHLLNVTHAFDIGLVAIKDSSRPVDVSAQRARAMEARCKELKQARTRYASDGLSPNGSAAHATNGSGPAAPVVRSAAAPLSARARRAIKLWRQGAGPTRRH